MEAWKDGLKAIAIYRDGCKRTQPLSTSKSDPGMAKLAALAVPTLADKGPPAAVRRKLPDERRSITHKFSVAGHEGYIHVGLYETGDPGEIFIRMAKEGSTISGLMDSFGTAISLAFQHGVPLRLLADKFTRTKFDPSGFTGNPEIPRASSIMDYIFRWLGAKFVRDESQTRTESDRTEPGRAEPAHQPGQQASQQPSQIEGSIDASGDLNRVSQLVAKGAVTPLASVSKKVEVIDATGHVNGNGNFSFIARTDAPTCPECGSIMIPNGSCHKCVNCGTTSGCS
ncbi:MAG: hypothetical protein H7X95_10760 [Deltaproteobacteria bacterium]|nr:hypothetical protein [Deltaproteobacteria bacterium]